MDPALLEPASVVASLVAVAWVGGRLAAWLDDLKDRAIRERPPRFRFQDGTTHPARTGTASKYPPLYGLTGVSGAALRRFEPGPAPENDPAAVLRGELDRYIRVKREFFRIPDAEIDRDPVVRDLLRAIREVEAGPALANDPEVVAIRQEIAAIDAATRPDEPTPEPAPTGGDAQWTPLRKRPAGRWVDD